MAALGAVVAGLFGGGGTGLSTTLGLVGTGISALGTIKAGQEAKAQAEYQQKVDKQNEDEAKAVSQREAMERRREGRIMLSRQRAAIAGAGGSTADDSVIDMMGDTAAAADLNARTEMFKGEQQARGYRDAQKVAKFQGDTAMDAAYIGAAGGIFSGLSNMYSRFGQQQKKVQTASAVQLPYG